MKPVKRTYTVVIPLYNKRNAVVETLRSVFAQHKPADEVIVVDDESTDGSDKLVEKVFNREIKSGQLRLVRQKNTGVSGARNAGVMLSRSRYICFLDADDLWKPEFLQEIDSLVDKFRDARAYTTCYLKIYPSGKVVKPKIRFRKKLSRCQLMENYFSVAARGDLPFHASNICVEKQLLSEIGGFPLNEPMGEDQDLWSKIALATQIAYSNRSLSYYRMDAENRACNIHCPESECPFSQRLYQFIRGQQLPRDLVKNITRYMATHLIDLARKNIRANNLDAAKKLLADRRCDSLIIKKIYAMGLVYLRVFINKVEYARIRGCMPS